MSLLDRLRRRRRSPSDPPSYSNASVIERISREHHVEMTTARHWFNEMLIFLDLCAESDKLLSPPPRVDHAWHAFVLHTRDYEAYCMERFGRMMHHQPAAEPDPKAYRRAYKRRRDWGPAPDHGIWAVPAGFWGPGGDSGGWFGDGDFGGGDFGGSGGGGGCGGGGS